MRLIAKAKGLLRNLWSDQSGQSVVEYALILALIIIVPELKDIADYFEEVVEAFFSLVSATIGNTVE